MLALRHRTRWLSMPCGLAPSGQAPPVPDVQRRNADRQSISEDVGSVRLSAPKPVERRRLFHRVSRGLHIGIGTLSDRTLPTLYDSTSPSTARLHLPREAYRTVRLIEPYGIRNDKGTESEAPKSKECLRMTQAPGEAASRWLATRYSSPSGQSRPRRRHWHDPNSRAVLVNHALEHAFTLHASKERSRAAQASSLAPRRIWRPQV